MAKIIKHTFKVPSLEVVDGELIENGHREETHTFTLLHKGFGLFEDLNGSPFMACLLDLGIDYDNVDEDKIDKETIEKLLSKDFVNNLACASYVKIEDNKFHNNRATAEEFKKTGAYQKLGEDIGFITKLVQMAIDCMYEETKSIKNTKANAQTKKQ